MVLSRLRLNPRHKDASRDLHSAYQMHATLCRALDEEGSGAPKFLWRLEPPKSSGAPTLLVQTEQQPSWNVLQQQPFSGYLLTAPESKAVYLSTLASGQALRFRLRANPTVTKYDPSAQKNKRHGLTRPEEQLTWLQAQSLRNGFEVYDAAVSANERLRVYKHSGGRPISLQSVLFDGHLRIQDVDTFKACLHKGLGHAKSLGFGLLSLAKA